MKNYKIIYNGEFYSIQYNCKYIPFLWFTYGKTDSYSFNEIAKFTDLEEAIEEVYNLVEADEKEKKENPPKIEVWRLY